MQQKSSRMYVKMMGFPAAQMISRSPGAAHTPEADEQRLGRAHSVHVARLRPTFPKQKRPKRYNPGATRRIQSPHGRSPACKSRGVGAKTGMDFEHHIGGNIKYTWKRSFARPVFPHRSIIYLLCGKLVGANIVHTPMSNTRALAS